MKFTHVTILLTILLALYGCGTKEVPDVDVEEAILYSPKGKFEFKQDKKNSSLFHADGISISLFPLDGNTLLRSSYFKTITIQEKKAYYLLNNSNKTSLTIKRSQTISNGFNVIAPVTMDYYQKDGNGLHVTRKRQHITSEHKKKVKQEIYRYYTPFTLDNEDYAIDITFQLEINTRLRFGVPGMP